MIDNIHYHSELSNIDDIAIYSHGCYADEFANTRFLVGKNVRCGGLSGTLFIHLDFDEKGVCTCRGDHVSIPYGEVFMNITYQFIGVKDGREYCLLNDTFDRVITGASGSHYINTPIGRVCTEGNDAIVYDEIFATISVDLYDDHKKRKRKKERIAMNGEIIVYGKR